MRTYPRNSPEAAARVVTLALLADGTLAPRELALLDRLAVHEQLGLSRAALQDVVQGFCEDLLSGSNRTWTDQCRIDPETLDQMLDEIDNPVLRLKVLELAIALVDADGEIVPAEARLIASAAIVWQIPLERWLTEPEPAL